MKIVIDIISLYCTSMGKLNGKKNDLCYIIDVNLSNVVYKKKYKNTSRRSFFVAFEGFMCFSCLFAHK